MSQVPNQTKLETDKALSILNLVQKLEYLFAIRYGKIVQQEIFHLSLGTVHRFVDLPGFLIA